MSWELDYLKESGKIKFNCLLSDSICL